MSHKWWWQMVTFVNELLVTTPPVPRTRTYLRVTRRNCKKKDVKHHIVLSNLIVTSNCITRFLRVRD